MFSLLAGLLPGDPSRWRLVLRELGEHIGAAIIAFDCAVDWRRDRQRGRYNPLVDETAVADAFSHCSNRLSQAGMLCVREFGHASRCADVLQSVFDRVPDATFLGPNDCRTLLERWGLARERGYVYARCDCCGVLDCAAGGCDLAGGAADIGCCVGDCAFVPCDCCMCANDSACCDKKQSRKNAGADKPKPDISTAGQSSQP